MYLEPNKSFKKMGSFYLSGIDLEFDEQDNLIIKSILNTENEDLKKIKPGAKVTQINDFEIADLRNPENIKKLKNTKETKDFIIEQNEQSVRISL
jgi:C-terminal processing protease CtpA/Prc